MDITLRLLTRAIQHRSTFGVPKKNMRLSIMYDDESCAKFYCRRSENKNDKCLYDEPLSTHGIIDGTCIKVEWVLSNSNMFFLAVGAVAVLPVATASAAAAGCVYIISVVCTIEKFDKRPDSLSVSIFPLSSCSAGSVVAYVAGYAVSTIAMKAGMQRLMASAQTMILAPDMPAGIQEIRKLL